MKAADITDDQVFAVVDRVKTETGAWTSISELWEALPGFPFKIVRAKVRQMISKGRIDGCGCGCRGDLERKPRS